MNTTIPGAEYAPTINLGIRPSTLGDWEPVERRLSVTDPDDRRAIVRRAAPVFGATEEEAERAFLVYSHNFDGWSLCVSRWATVYALWSGPQGHGPDQISHATGALCAHVWGPK